MKQEDWKDQNNQHLSSIPLGVAKYRRHSENHSRLFEKSFSAALLRVSSRIIQNEVQACACDMFAISLPWPLEIQLSDWD